MSVTTYRALLRLYPQQFRRDYGDDLAQIFDDLVADHGLRGAWVRTAPDLLVTVPRYRLEYVMSDTRSSLVLGSITAALAAAGLFTVMAGFLPGIVLLVAAIALSVGERGQLARAVRTPSSSLRRRRLIAAALCAAVFLAAVASYASAIGGDHISDRSLLLHNLVGIPSLVGALVFLIVGILTPRPTSIA